jgi:hypothetical protein
VALTHNSKQGQVTPQALVLEPYPLVAAVEATSHSTLLQLVDQAVVVEAPIPPQAQVTQADIHLSKVSPVEPVTVLLAELVVVALAVLEQTVEATLVVTVALAHLHTTAQVSAAYFQSLA